MNFNDEKVVLSWSANKAFVRCRLHVVTTTLNLFAQYSVKTARLSSYLAKTSNERNDGVSRPYFLPRVQTATKSKHPHNDSSRWLVISETQIVGRRSRRTRTGNGSVGRSTRTRGLFPTGTSTTASTNTTLTSVSIYFKLAKVATDLKCKLNLSMLNIQERARPLKCIIWVRACVCSAVA